MICLQPSKQHYNDQNSRRSISRGCFYIWIFGFEHGQMLINAIDITPRTTVIHCFTVSFSWKKTFPIKTSKTETPQFMTGYKTVASMTETE